MKLWFEPLFNNWIQRPYTWKQPWKEMIKNQVGHSEAGRGHSTVVKVHGWENLMCNNQVFNILNIFQSYHLFLSMGYIIEFVQMFHWWSKLTLEKIGYFICCFSFSFWYFEVNEDCTCKSYCSKYQKDVVVHQVLKK